MTAIIQQLIKCSKIDLPKIYDKCQQYLCQLLLVLIFWSIVWSIYGQPALPPNGHLYHLILLFTLSCICGKLCKLVACPPLFGSLIIGFLYGNLLSVELDNQLCSVLRSASLVSVLLEAGLELDPKVIRKLSFVALRMAFVPMMVEVVAITFATYWLIQFPIKWGFLLGFVLAAASPAIVVPGMLNLQKRQLGVDKGIPTLVIAAASIDDILAITGFSICLGQVFTSNESLVWTVLKGPVEAVAGALIAAAIGVLLWYIPNKDESKLERITLLVMSGVAAMFVSQSLGLESFGTIACITLAFVAALKWRDTGRDRPVLATLKISWSLFEPLLFALIGYQVKIADLHSNAIGLAVLALIIALVLRTVSSMFVIIGANLNLKEKIYVSIAWIPKATVQAAIGSVALDLARQRGNDPQLIEFGTFVLTVSVLSILITAPLGAIWISFMGSRCLKVAVPSAVVESIHIHDRGNVVVVDAGGGAAVSDQTIDLIAQ
ncbi:sodium/hydrogen exchanger 9B2-like [Oppia nitens]|uniref:sodium/hydrogen exchanger 9B2-like n=1 Tax=Oppia nitens TaxID=1686743 RepID=UPI0023DC4948|nr:sodium/hydrogen exchanger 9B2-like [Oppia nitens]